MTLIYISPKLFGNESSISSNRAILCLPVSTISVWWVFAVSFSFGKSTTLSGTALLSMLIVSWLVKIRLRLSAEKYWALGCLLLFFFSISHCAYVRTLIYCLCCPWVFTTCPLLTINSELATSKDITRMCRLFKNGLKKMLRIHFTDLYTRRKWKECKIQSTGSLGKLRW